MKASLTSILYSALALATFCACNSNSYKINGTAEGLADGDTLFLTSDMETGLPSDTIILKDGKFSLSGETDTVMLCMIYSSKRNDLNAPFFLESGNINISLKDTPGESRVGGTLCNDGWQQLNDSVMLFGKEINRIAERIYGGNTTPEEQQKGMAQIEQANKRFADLVVRTTEKNIDNEFGYFLLMFYPEELINNESRSRLIQMLPTDKRQRQAIKDMEQAIKKAANTDEGNTIEDFAQATPDGETLTIMSEISKNRITVIDFWASWCGPCRQEMPLMVELYKKYKDSGLGIVGVSLDSDRDAWLLAIGQLKMEWPQMSDLKGWDNAAAQQFNISSIPHTMVVDQNGKILRRGLRGEQLQSFIAEQLQ